MSGSSTKNGRKSVPKVVEQFQESNLVEILQTITNTSECGTKDEPNSKSSSTKSKKSKISSGSSHGSSNGIHFNSTTTPKRQYSISSSILNQPHPPNSWVEQIQFKAQYCHFRCNDYVSVINSARSLDKVEELDQQQQYGAKINIGKSGGSELTSTRKTSTSFEQHNNEDIITSVSSNPTTTKQHHSNPLFCWNFPRVKLRRLFNAKSLDDILDRNQIQAQAQPKRKEVRSQSSTCSVINTTTIKDNTKNISGSVSSTAFNRPGPSKQSGSKIPADLSASSTLAQLPSKTTTKSKKSSKPNESCSANIAKSKLKSSPSSSSFENSPGGCIRRTKIDEPAIPVVVVDPVVKESTINTDKTSGSQRQESSKDTQSCLVSAQPSSCMNSQSKTESSSSSMRIPCCGKISNSRIGTGTSPSVVVEAVNDSETPEHETVKPSSSSKKKISFLKPINKVTALTSPDEYEISQTMNSGSDSSCSQPRLVVASVSYLQSPIYSSESGTSPTPTPGSRTTSEDDEFKSQDFGAAGVTPNVIRNYQEEGPGSGSVAVQNSPFIVGPVRNEFVHHGVLKKPEYGKMVKDAQYENDGTNRLSQQQNVQSSSSRAGIQKSRLKAPFDYSDSKAESVKKSDNKIQKSGKGIKSSSITSPDSIGVTDDHQQPVKMSDLQSPQYVKKIAHMFNSKISSNNGSITNTSSIIQRTTSTSTTTLIGPHHNGSFLPKTSPNTKNSTSSPSYLNVSKTISGYSGLSYNSSNGNSTSTDHHHEQQNGNVTTTNGNGVAKITILPVQKNGINDYTSLLKQSPLIEAQDEHGHDEPDNDNEKPPPPLPKTGPPSPFTPDCKPTTHEEKNGNYFLKIVRLEKSKIELLISKATEQLDGLDQSSEESGVARAAIGKARLLINKKFKQFEELCQTNLNEHRQGTSGEPFTTQNDDLAGFWDMVLIQVAQIHIMFQELDPKFQKSTDASLPDAHFHRTLVPRTDPLKTGSPSKSLPAKIRPSASSSTSNARDESRRKLLAERRKAMRNQVGGDGGNSNGATASEPDVQIFVPESQ